MRHFLTILGLLLGTMLASAAEVTATVTKYNAAALSGDVTSGMTVSFLNQVKNKGTVSQGDVAVLTISGMPTCTITDMVLYAKSNTQSGAATVKITMNDLTTLVAEGDFKDWPGRNAYSAEIVPIPLWHGSTTMQAGASVTLTVAGITNSITIDRWVITYTPAAPVVHTVTLHWVDADHTVCSQTLCEDEVGVGVWLPAVTDTVRENETRWTCIGWSEQPVVMTDEEPQYWEADNWYMPEYDTHLYGVYTDKQTAWVTQDTTYQTGDYAVGGIWADSLFLWSGGWNDGRIKTHAVAPQVTPAGLYQIATRDLTDDEVYTMTFTADSVSIRSAVGSYIGYSAGGPVKAKTPWAWQKADNGSLYIYSECISTTPYWKGKALKLTVDNLENIQATTCIQYGNDFWDPTWSYWFLFPITDLPTDGAHWTTFPELTPVHAPQVHPSVHKIWHNGQVWILSNTLYNILGQ